MRRKLILIGLTAVIIRLVISMTTFHHDLQPFLFAGRVIAEGNVLNFYDFIGSLPEENIIRQVYPSYLFNYPPAVYFTLGPISYLLSLLFDTETLNAFIFDIRAILGTWELVGLLLLMKIHYVVIDVLIGVVLYKLFEKPKEKILAFALWMANPIALFATFMMGQFDLIPVFFVLLALFVVKKRLTSSRLVLGGVLLGIGAAYKIYPMMLLVPFALLAHGNWMRVKVFLAGVLIYVLTILPFLNSSGFRQSALLAGQTLKSLHASIPISGGEAILLFPVFVIFLYIYFYYGQNRVEDLWEKFFVMLLLFFIFTHYHPQWFLWLSPFIIIDLIKSNFKHWPLAGISLISFLGLLTFFDPGLTVWLFSPVWPQLYGMAGIWDILGVELDVNFMRSLLQSLFVAPALYYIYYYVYSRRPRRSR